MKKFLLIAVAAFGMLMTACSKDEVAQPVGGEESVVTFTVEAPVMQTRTHGDGYSATELTVLVYQRGGDLLFEKEAEMVGLKTTVELPFVNGMEYDLVFWAEAENSPYTLDKANKTVGYTDVNALVGNSEAYDAFYAYVNDIPEITGPVTKTVELKRPFAQLNIITNDATEAAKSGLVVKNVAVTVKNGYTAFDFVSGNGINEGAVTFGLVAKQSDTTLAVNYLFTGGEKSLVDVEFTYTDEAGKLGTNGLTKEYATVPVQRNYRTNIIGSLLTSEGVFEVEIKKDFATDEHNVEIVTVASATELVDEITNGDADQIILTGDINLNDLLSRAADKNLAIPAGRTVTLDLGGHTLSAVSTQTGKNYDMIDVRGTLTVANGTITTKHEGQNMAWNNSTNVFNVTAGGVLNLESVVAKNLGGSDMAYVAHLNNWGEVTLNVNNSTLESPYVAVRVFNSGYDMNNVTIKNSTLKAKNCVWVHNYTAADFGTQDKADAQKALLNFDILNGTNTFEYTAAAVRLGMTNSIYLNEDGHKLVYSADDLARAIAAGGEITLQNDIEVDEVILIGNSVKIHGNDHSISTTKANRVMRITAPEINVELNNVNIVSNTVRVGTNDIRGISVDNTAAYLTLTLNDCNIDFTDDSAHDWAYAVNQTATSHNTISINGGTYEGANVINIWGSNNTINIDGATLNCLYKPNTQYHGSCITFNSGASDNTVTVKNTTFNSPGGNAKVKWDEGSNNTVSHENNTDNTTVATFVTTTEALAEAVAVGGNVFLGADITVDETVIIPEGKTVVLDLNGKTLSAADKNTIKNNGGILTIKNGTVTRTGNVVGYAVNNASGEIYVENATVKLGLYTSGSKFVATNANISHEQSTRHAIYAYNCEVTINGGTYHNNNAGNATLMAAGTSVVNILDGTFSIADGRTAFGWTSCLLDTNGTAQINIKNGLYNGGFRVNTGAEMTIDGGSFNDCYGSNYNINSTTIVKGGTYTDAAAQAFAQKYLAEGYKYENGTVVAE